MWSPLSVVCAYGDVFSSHGCQECHRNNLFLRHTVHRSVGDTSAIASCLQCQDLIGVPLQRIAQQILREPDDGEEVRHRACNTTASIPQTVCKYRSLYMRNGLLHEANLLFGASFFSDGNLEHLFGHIYHRIVEFGTHVCILESFL